MKLRLVILAALGLAVALYLVTYVGWHAVFAAAAAVGWGGFAIFCLCALGLFVLLGAAWYVLLAASAALRTCGCSSGRAWCAMRSRRCCRSRSSVESHSACARRYCRAFAAPLAVASMIADVTTEMLAQICLCCARRRDSDDARPAKLAAWHR